jgi:hypothetical protein
MKVCTFSLFISAVFSIPSIVGSVGSVGTIRSLRGQVKGLDVGKGLATDIGQIPKVDNVVKGSDLRTVGESTRSAVRDAEGDLRSVNEVGRDTTFMDGWP